MINWVCIWLRYICALSCELWIVQSHDHKSLQGRRVNAKSLLGRRVDVKSLLGRRVDAKSLFGRRVNDKTLKGRQVKMILKTIV